MINQQTWRLYGLLGKHMFMLPNSNIMAYISDFSVNVTDRVQITMFSNKTRHNYTVYIPIGYKLT